MANEAAAPDASDPDYQEYQHYLDYQNYLSAQAKPAAQTTPAAAMLEHYGNVATAGYLPQAQAAAAMPQGSDRPPAGKAGKMPLGDDTDRELEAQGFKIIYGDTYLKDRDANAARLAQEFQEHPGYAIAGAVPGALALGAATNVVAPINAATTMGRLAQAARGGAFIGAVSNPGDRPGEIAGGPQIDDRAMNAVKGAGMSAAFQGAAEGLSKIAGAVSRLPQSMQTKAEERAFKSSGAMIKDYRKVTSVPGGRDAVNDVGRFMIDNGLVKPGMTVGDVADASESMVSSVGKKIGDAYDRAIDALKGRDIPLANLNPKDLAQEFMTEFTSAQKGVAGGGDRLRSVQAVVNDLAQMPDDAGLAGVNRFRQGLDDLVYAHGKTPGTLPETKQAMAAFRNWLDQRVDGAISAIDRATGGTVSQELPALNQQYGVVRKVAAFAKDQALRQEANRILSPSDYGSGAAGAMIGALTGDGSVASTAGRAAIGATAGLVNKAARTYGNPIAATVLDRAGRAMAATPLPEMAGAAASTLRAAPVAYAATAAAQGDNRPRGEQLWAQQGLNKLGITNGQQLLADPRARELLIRASDLQPGSAALKRIQDQLQKGWGRR